MAENILEKLGMAIRNTGELNVAKRGELLTLMAQLKEQEEGTAGSKSGIEEFRESILEFETSHPDLMEMTSRACKMLSDNGI